MKLATTIILAAAGTASAFSPLGANVRTSAVKPLNYGWDQYNAAKAAPAAPAPPAPAAPVAPPAPVPPVAAAPVAPVAPAAPAAVVEDEPMSQAWAAQVDYDPSTDVFPEFPPHYRSFDEIWAEFQAKKAAGQL